MRDDQPRLGLVCLKVNKLHATTHHSGGLLIFVKMKKHFLQYNIELFPLPDEINNGLYIYRHGCFTGKYTTRKIHTELHTGPER